MIKFFERLREGLSLGAQKGFAKSLNRVYDILENLDGAPYSGIKVKRLGDQWRIHYDGSQGESSLPLLYPFKTTLTKDGSDDVVNVLMGRVFEANASDTSATSNADFALTELPNDGLLSVMSPGDTWSSTPTATSDYVVLVVMRGTGGEIDRKYLIGFESEFSSGYMIIKRIARYYQVSGTGMIEQIHMGDVSFSEIRMAPFSLARLGSDIIMYLPPGSIMLNGKDFTSDQTGLTAASMIYWYDVTSFLSSTLNLYVKMDDTAGQFGKPVGVEFGSSAPTHSGEIITIKVLGYTSEGFYNVTHGAVVLDIVRPDGNKSDSHCVSIAKATTDGNFTDEDKTIGLHGFQTPVTPSGTIFDTGDSCTHHVALREADGTDTKLKWLSDASLLAAIKQELLDDEDWKDDLGIYDCDCTYDFWTWYETVSDGDRFWKQNADEGTNYGASIGDTSKFKVIDLDVRMLCSSWGVGGSLDVGTDLYVLGTTLSVNGKTLVFNQDGTVTWQ